MLKLPDRTTHARRPIASFVLRIVGAPRRPTIELLHLHSGEARRFRSPFRLQRWLREQARAMLR